MPQNRPLQKGGVNDGDRMDAQEARLAWVLIMPTAVIVLGLVIFPAIFSIWISFHKVGLGDLNNVFQTQFVGLDNFKSVVNDFAFKPGPFPPEWAEANLFQKIWLSLTKWNWGAAITTLFSPLLRRFGLSYWVWAHPSY